MISFLKPSPDAARLPAERIDPEYRRLRWQVFAGIFIGYAARVPETQYSSLRAFSAARPVLVMPQAAPEGRD